MLSTSSMSMWLGILRSFFKLFNFSKFLPAKAQVTLFASKYVLKAYSTTNLPVKPEAPYITKSYYF